MPDRISLLWELIRNPRPAPFVARELENCRRGDARHLVTVGRIDVLEILRQFCEGLLNPEEVEAWALRLESRGDVGFEFGEEGAVAEAVCWLAYPDADHPIDRELCRRIAAMFEHRQLQ